MHSDENELSTPFAEKKSTAALWVSVYAVLFIALGVAGRAMTADAETDMVWLWRMLVLGPALLLLVWFDVREFRLPDMITLPLILSGLVFATLGDANSLLQSALGAAFGYILILGLRWFWLHYRGHPGIGLGDAKLLAAGGAWLGIGLLPGAILLSSLVGFLLIVFSVVFRQQKNLNDKTLMPFGPALSAAIWGCESFSTLLY